MSFNSLVLRIANLFSRPLLGRTRLYPRLSTTGIKSRQA